MNIANSLRFPALLLTAFLYPGLASGVTLGQVDTFQNGTAENWVINLLGTGNPPSAVLPTNIASGGPGGANDRYLQLASSGLPSAGGRLTVINAGQWSGDYSATGILSIAMDLINLGASDLSIRLYLENPTIGPPTDTAITTALSLPAGSGWTHTAFALDPSSLTALTGDVDTLLSNVTALRIFHGPAAAFPGPTVGAVLGVDNITALPVPEPSSFLLCSLGLAAVLVRRGMLYKNAA